MASDFLLKKEMTMSQQNSKRRCPSCGLDNDPNALYCGGCGYQFTRYALGSTTDLRRATTTSVDNLIATAIPPLYPGFASHKKRNIIRVVFFTVLAILIIGTLILGINIGRGGSTVTNNAINTPTTGIVPISGNTPVQ